MYPIQIRYFLRSLLLTFSLFLFSVPVVAEITPSGIIKSWDDVLVYNDGRFEGVRAKHARTGSMWTAVVDWDEGKYYTNMQQDFRFRGQHGQSTSSSVKGKYRVVSNKKTVWSNLLKNGKLGGALAKAGAIGWAVTAFQLIDPYLVEGGWVYDHDLQTWVRAKKIDQQCVSFSSGYNSDYSVCGELAPDYSDSDLSNLKNQLCRDFVATFNRSRPSYCAGDVIYSSNDSCISRVSMTSGSCIVGHVFSIPKIIEKSPISQQEFDDIIQIPSDRNPTPFVNLSAPNQGSEIPGTESVGVELPPSPVKSDPFTNPINGQPEQTEFSPENDTTGKTTIIRTQSIPRPDLQPNSDVAPVPNPNEIPQPNPNPGTNPDEQPKPEETPDLCKSNPSALACQELGDYEPEDIHIPKQEKSVSFLPDLFLPANGTCPQPITFNALNQTYNISYEPLCDFCSRIRAIVLLSFMVAAAYIVMGAMKES